MKTLKTLLVLAKIGKILSKIVFVCCLVGFFGCLVGISGLAFGEKTLKVGGLTLHTIVEEQAEMTMSGMYAAMAVGVVLCAAEAVLAGFAETYFKNVLADGEFFTFGGAKELMRLGILTIVLPLAATIACSIGVSIAEHWFPDIGKVAFDGYNQVGLGVMMIVAALLCRYGAEKYEGKVEE